MKKMEFSLLIIVIILTPKTKMDNKVIKLFKEIIKFKKFHRFKLQKDLIIMKNISNFKNKIIWCEYNKVLIIIILIFIIFYNIYIKYI